MAFEYEGQITNKETINTTKTNCFTLTPLTIILVNLPRLGFNYRLPLLQQTANIFVNNYSILI